MLKRKIESLVFSCILLFFVFTCTQCSYSFLPKESPSLVVEKYAAAMKDYDMLTMQKYLSSDANKTNSAAAGILGSVVGGLTGFNFNMDNLLTLAGPLYQFNKSMGGTGPFDYITLKNIENEEINEDENGATVLALYEFDLSSLKDELGDSNLSQNKFLYRTKYHMVIEENEWKINKEENLDRDKLMQLLQSFISDY